MQAHALASPTGLTFAAPRVDDPTFNEWTGMPDEQREEIKALLILLARAGTSPRISTYFKEQALYAQRPGWSAVSLKRKWLAYRAARGDWRSLRDLRKISTTDRQLGLSATFLDHWQSLVIKNQRKTRPAHRALLRQLAQWRSGNSASAIPGYEIPPPDDPATGVPHGWHYRNLLRHQPDEWTLKAARIGRSAADANRVKVPTTRAGLLCGQFYLFDDLWHDIHVSHQGQLVRPLQLGAVDLASAKLVRYGMRPRLERADGTHDQIKEREMRFIVAAVLACDGYRTDEIGTTLVVEHGTAAISETMEAALRDHLGVTVDRSGILGPSGWAGQYDGRSKGNFRFKAALESLHNLIHNETAALPAPSGKDRDHAPEQTHGIKRYHDALVAAMAALPPEKAALLRLPALTWRQFDDILARIYDSINARRDHRLEGWAECGHEMIEWLVGDTWLSQRSLLASPVSSALSLSLSEVPSRVVRLSPSEVWKAGSAGLRRLSHAGAAVLLGPDLARERSVTAGLIEFEDADIGAGKHAYLARATTPMGNTVSLRDGERYACLANPFAPDHLLVLDAKGGFIGACKRWDRIRRDDVEGLHRKMGEVAHLEKERLTELARIGAKDTRDRIALHEHNARILTGEDPHATAAQRRLERAADSADLTDDDRTLFNPPDSDEPPHFSADEISDLLS
jgi:hypothetical protein